MSVESTNKYLRANDAYNELFDAFEALNIEPDLQRPLNAALVTLSNILDYWKENNDVHTKPRESEDNPEPKKNDNHGFSLVE